MGTVALCEYSHNQNSTCRSFAIFVPIQSVLCSHHSNCGPHHRSSEILKWSIILCMCWRPIFLSVYLVLHTDHMHCSMKYIHKYWHILSSNEAWSSCPSEDIPTYNHTAVQSDIFKIFQLVVLCSTNEHAERKHLTGYGKKQSTEIFTFWFLHSDRRGEKTCRIL